MSWPKISMIWLNYNSERNIDIVVESLSSLFDVDYPRYEIIIVDNGSTDRSPHIINKWLNKNKSASKSRYKFIRLTTNRGFTGGNNVGFRFRDKDSKYISLVNNDFIINKDSLRRLIEIFEQHDWIGGMQGIIARWDGRIVANMGLLVDELLLAHAIYAGYPVTSVSKPRVCTFVSGAFSIYRVDYILDVMGGDRIFDDIMFAYFDDMILGMRMWSHNYAMVGVPVFSGRHYSSLSFGRCSPFQIYLISRASFVMGSILKKYRYKDLSPLIRILHHLNKCNKLNLNYKMMDYIYSIYKAYQFKRRIMKCLNNIVDFSKVPIMKYNYLKRLFYNRLII